MSIQQFFSKSAINTINTAEAVAIDSTVASITVGAVLADGQTLKLGKNGATEMIFTPHGTAGSKKISLTNTGGTAADAIAFTSTAGGVTLTPASGKNVSIGGILAITTEIAVGSEPSAPDDGAGGYLYTKADGKPYWVSNDVSETDLSASGSGASLSGTTANQITTVTGANAIQGESKLTFNGTTLAVTGALTTSTTITATGNITASAFIVNTPQTITIHDTSSSANITATAVDGDDRNHDPTSSIIYLDVLTGATATTYHWDLSGFTSPAAGTILHLFYDNSLVTGAKLQVNFGTSPDKLSTGSGLNQFLTFSNDGESASLIYINSQWRILNTGAAVS